MQRIVHADPSCRVCRTSQPGLVATAGPLPPPYSNPRAEFGDPHWYHGTSFDPKESGTDQLQVRKKDFSEPNTEYKHWNTDFGTHFSSLHDVAKTFAKGRDAYTKPLSRVAHADLHMRNPIHFDNEHDMADHAINTALGHGLKHGPAEAEHPEHEDIDEYGPDEHSLASKDTWINSHPHREKVVDHFVNDLHSKGHDGITYGNNYEGPEGHTCAIAFAHTPITVHKWEHLHHDHPEHIAMKTVGGVGGPELGFEHEEEENGGSTWPDTHTLHGVHPETGDRVGWLKYRTPRRAKDKIKIDRLEIKSDHRGNGYGGQLMDELQKRHPKTPIDHGDRTDDGKKWWAGYSKDKSVQKGRTIASAGNDWQFEHRQIEGGPSWRTFGGPADEPRKHMLEYRKPQEGKIDFGHDGFESGVDRLRNRKGQEAGDRMERAVLDHHNATHYDPVADAPPPPKAKPKIYYHGTTQPDVTHILPAVRHNQGVMFPSVTSNEHAYATLNKDTAWHYAALANDITGGKPRVYQVRPIGGHKNVEADPHYDERGNARGNFEDDHRSKHGFEVVRELKTPQHVHDSFDWPGKEHGE